MIEKFKKMPCFLKIISVVILVFLQFNAIAQKDTVVVISTSYGIIKLKLYDDTPIHKHNILKLVRNGVYDSLLFHRIINGFMIQGGDPDSKRADANQIIGNGDIGYTLPAEINPLHFHKKGALAAARQGDDVNPDKRSSGCQFYIVHGKKFAELDMVTVESRMAGQLKQSLILKYLGKPENIELKKRYTFISKPETMTV
jgi:peptidylprolyl isomerase